MALQASPPWTFVSSTVSGVALNIIAPARLDSSPTVLHRPARLSISQSPMSKAASTNRAFRSCRGGRFGWEVRIHVQWLEFSTGSGSRHAVLLIGYEPSHWLTILAIVVIPIATTCCCAQPFGLRLRSAGEKPSAADSLGSTSTASVTGAQPFRGPRGLGGFYLAINGAGRYSEGQCRDAGFIAWRCSFRQLRPLASRSLTLYGFIECVRLCCSGRHRALVLLVSLALARCATHIVRRKWPASSARCS